MFAQYISEATTLGVAVIISETTSFAEGKHHSKKPNLSSRQIRLFCWPARRDSNPRPLESESTAISSFATGGWCARFASRLYCTPLSTALQEEICNLKEFAIRIRREQCLAAARSTRGSDSPQDCHSLPLVPLRYPRPTVPPQVV